MTTIVDLPPEIIGYVGLYIDKRDVLNLILTCRLFHQNFLPLLWRETSLNAKRSNPNSEQLRANAHLVHDLKFTHILPSDYFDITFPNLRVLQRHEPYEAQVAEEVELNWTRFIRRHPKVQDLVFSIDRHFQATEFWEAITTSLQRPRRLQVRGMACTFQDIGEAEEAFWRACSLFKDVDYEGGYLLWSFLTAAPVDFSWVETLSYLATEFSGDQLEGQMMLFKRCRNLRKLHMLSKQNDVLLDGFAKLLEHGWWPYLEDVYLGGTGSSYNPLVSVISNLPPLKHFGLESMNFDSLCFGHLRRRQFDSLRSLDLTGCHKVTSRMALDVVLHCHQLEDFRAPRIFVTDLKSTPQPWVCHGLKRLSVFFASDPVDPSADSLIFEQLSRLKWLESLDLSQQHKWLESIGVSQRHDSNVIWSRPIMSTALQTVKLRLDSGLAQLATLTRLRSFIFYNTDQNMEGEDVEWMLTRWRCLANMYGDFSKDPSTQYEFLALLKDRGVLTTRQFIC
ncbi:MAG: hypothetical protein JOS17DRAFT_772042 [Linnemannia elongata]|nr:MAG: hypothetical protein JOS17DRAFT_772042 [Linnemannia elongata]